MRRVLFVDDEPQILDGLRRMLRGMRREWEMEFVSSGEQALEAIRQAPFDVVISDMRMPGMDGAQLLSEVKRLQPETIRIILSGYSEREAVLKAIGSTHQYLSKPCDPEILKETIGRTEALQKLLGGESIQGLITQMDSLPSLPTLFQEIVQALQRPNASLVDIGKIIAKDIGMSAKILQIVNSAYFGLTRPLTNVERAVSHLGLEMINALVVTTSVFSQYEGPSIPEFSADSVWSHSMQTGAFARAVCAEEQLDKRTADDAFLAAMLHDAGKVILAANATDGYRKVLRRVKQEGIPVSIAEQEALGTTHAGVAAYLVKLWGLPDPIVEAIAYHVRPTECPVRQIAPLTVVHVASGLARELDGPDTTSSPDLIDLDYIGTLGLEDRLPVWREACRKTLEQGSTA